MTGHTPAPWVAKARAVDSTGQDDYFLGWDITGPPEAQRGQFARAADARLAAAAPELYEALKAMLNPDTEGDIDIAMVALRKAEGREP